MRYVSYLSIYLSIYLSYTVMAKNIGTLGKLSGSLCQQPSLHTHLFTISSLLVITCLLIPHTCCTSSSLSISDHSQHSLLVRSTVHYPELCQTPYLCFLPLDPPTILLRCTPLFQIPDLSLTCKDITSQY